MKGLSLGLLAIVVFCTAEAAEAASSWDGIWKGYWHQKRLVTITIQNGIPADLFSNEHHSRPFGTQIHGETFSFDTRNNHIVLTRTGENSADGMKTGTFNGRKYFGGLASGYDATSTAGLFTRQ